MSHPMSSEDEHWADHAEHQEYNAEDSSYDELASVIYNCMVLVTIIWKTA